MSNQNILATPPNTNSISRSDAIGFERENMVTPTVRAATVNSVASTIPAGAVHQGRLSQATPLVHNRSHHAQPTTPAKRNRTHHPTDDSTIFNSNRSKMVVSRNKTNNGSAVNSTSGHASSGFTYMNDVEMRNIHDIIRIYRISWIWRPGG